jgi:hypothetical protein
MRTAAARTNRSIMLIDHTSMTDALLQQAAEATRRWEQLFTAETGDLAR